MDPFFSHCSCYLMSSLYLCAAQVKDDSVTVMEVKQILAEVFGIPAGEQSIVFSGKALLGNQNMYCNHTALKYTAVHLLTSSYSSHRD